MLSSCVTQGIGIDETLEAVVKRIPAPQDTASRPLRALIFDSHYDSYKVLLQACLTVCALPVKFATQHTPKVDCMHTFHAL